jgi:colanic acid biosynthesis protein WcaH
MEDLIPEAEYTAIRKVLPVVGVELIVVKDDHVLLGKRNNEPCKGLWALPGGRMLKDELIIDAVHRQAMKELGIEVEIKKELCVNQIFIGGLHWIVFEFLVKPKSDNIKLDSQHSEYMWARTIPPDIAEPERLRQLFKEAGLHLDQREAHEKWVVKEGTREGPTHLETLMKPEQQARINWLVEHAKDARSILDIGCNRGFILNEISVAKRAAALDYGVDINPVNLAQARKDYPYISFIEADITDELDIDADFVEVVIEADLLEHLIWSKVPIALKEGVRIASHKLLITLPWLLDDKCALCFKHRWVPDEEKVGTIIMQLTQLCHQVNVSCDGQFVYIEAVK